MTLCPLTGCPPPPWMLLQPIDYYRISYVWASQLAEPYSLHLRAYRLHLRAYVPHLRGYILHLRVRADILHTVHTYGRTSFALFTLTGLLLHLRACILHTVHTYGLTPLTYGLTSFTHGLTSFTYGLTSFNYGLTSFTYSPLVEITVDM